jgi:hypothetical protein
MEKTYQHIVPRGYLRAWSTPNPPRGHSGKIWVHQKMDPKDKVLRSPKNYFGRENQYTVTTGGARDLSVEDALGQVEKAFGDVMVRIREKQPFRSEDRADLSFFAAAMLARVERFTAPIGGMLRSSLAQARRQEEQHGLGNEGSDKIAEELANHVGDTVSIATVENQKVLAVMSLVILTVADEDGFMTSDAPGHLCVPDGSQSPLLRSQKVEFTLPLSPHHMAIYTHRGAQPRYEVGTRGLVDEANSRRVNGCVKEFVSWKGVVRQEWLESV